jgi:hypothetical protein
MVVRLRPRRRDTPSIPSSHISRATRFFYDLDALVAKLGVHPSCAIRPPALLIRVCDQPFQLLILVAPGAGITRQPRVEALPRDADHRAQPGDPVLGSLHRDEPKPHLGASLSLAKKAAALRRISFLAQHANLPAQPAQLIALLTRQALTPANVDVRLDQLTTVTTPATHPAPPASPATADRSNSQDAPPPPETPPGTPGPSAP